MADTNMDQLLRWLKPLVQRAYTGRTAIKTEKGHSIWTDEPLTNDLLRAHLADGPLRGVCPIKPGDDRTAILLFDLDDHGDAMAWGEKADAAQRILDAAEARGVYLTAVSSSGGAGIHLIGLWQKMQDAYSVRALGQEILDAAGYSEGTSGLENGQAEIFPKQDRVPEDGAGNQFILPLGGESYPLEPMLDLEPVERDAVSGAQWTYCEPVEQRERPALPEQSGASGEQSVTLAEARSALAAIPNDGEGIGYDEWRDLIFALHYIDDGLDGLALAHEFSARSSKYDADFLEQRVWPYIRRERSNVITGGTILRKAAEYGWAPPDELVAQELATVNEDGDDVDEGNEPSLPKGLDRDQNGVIKNTLSNITLMVGHASATGYEVAHDAFQGQTMIAEADGRKQWRPFKDSDYTQLRLRCEAWGGKPIGREAMRDAVDWVAETREFDSAIQWLTQEVPEWDGVERVGPFFAQYFGVDDSEYTRACGRYFWSALAGRVLTPGVKADMIVVLTGTQGLGKSSGAKAIVPDPQFFFEVDLRDSDADLARQMRGKLLGELDELRGMSKRDMEHVKSFASRTHEQWIPKYREAAYTYPRRCVFLGTANAHQFLMDETGNRRFLPLTAGEVDVDAVANDRLQLWAEARDLYQQSGVLYAQAEELARQYHAQYQWQDPWESAIADWLGEASLTDETVCNGDTPFATEDVLRSALDVPVGRQGNRDAARVSSIMRKLGYESTRMRVSGHRVYRWVPS